MLFFSSYCDAVARHSPPVSNIFPSPRSAAEPKHRPHRTATQFCWQQWVSSLDCSLCIKKCAQWDWLLMTRGVYPFCLESVLNYFVLFSGKCYEIVPPLLESNFHFSVLCWFILLNCESSCMQPVKGVLMFLHGLPNGYLLSTTVLKRSAMPCLWRAPFVQINNNYISLINEKIARSSWIKFRCQGWTVVELLMFKLI